MAQQLQNITIAAPGFGGINTQDSPLLQPQGFASICDNAVIDKQGRIAARKGHSMVSTNGASVLGSSDGIEHINEFVQEDGVKVFFSAGNNAIFSGDTTLTDITPGAYTITANNWSSCSLGNKFYMFQRDHAPLVYDPSTSALTLITAHAAAQGTPPHAHICLAAYGRVWAADVTGNKKTLYWSDLLDGVDWNSGSSGSLDLTNVWPSGYDEITALGTHNNFLIIFGKHSLIVYAGADDPSTMVLSDTVENIGAVSRDVVVSIGSDLIFVDFTGVRSLGRTIQEKSAPIGDISRNVNFDIKTLIAADHANIKTVFDPNNAFVLIAFTGIGSTYAFDTRFPLDDGSLRATTWSSILPLAFLLNDSDELLFGIKSGVSKYNLMTDIGNDYVMSYYSHPMDFGDSSRLKFLKKINLITFQGSEANVTLQWAYDYKSSYKKRVFTLPQSNEAFYNLSEFNEGAEYSESPQLINEQRVNASGSGTVVQIGLETTVSGKEIAIQQLNVQSLVGRML